MRGYSFAIIFAAMTFVSACANAQSTNGSNAGFHTIAIISAIGDTINLAETGLFVHAKRPRLIDIQSWHFDDEVENLIASNLGADWKVQHIDYDRSAFSKETIDPIFSADVKDPPIHDLLSKLQPAVDFYLVVSKQTEPAAWQVGNALGGLNFTHEKEMIRSDPYRAYVSASIELIDAKSGRTISKSRIWIHSGIWLSDHSVDIDPSFWPAPDDQLTKAQSAGLHKRLLELLSPEIKRSMAEMHLSGEAG